MPLIVAHKPSSTVTNVKLRLIHDCRYVNRHLEHFPFSMERLKDFAKQLCHLDRLFAIDIASAYHHVMIAPRFRTLLGFTFEGVDYVYDTLPFGLSFSAYVFCTLSGVTAAYIRASGLTTALINYCDDFIGSIGPAYDRLRMRRVVEIFLAFGWVLQPSKLTLDMACSIEGLGFVLDTVSMQYSIPARRQQKLLGAVDETLSGAQRAVGLSPPREEGDVGGASAAWERFAAYPAAAKAKAAAAKAAEATATPAAVEGAVYEEID